LEEATCSCNSRYHIAWARHRCASPSAPCCSHARRCAAERCSDIRVILGAVSLRAAALRWCCRAAAQIFCVILGAAVEKSTISSRYSVGRCPTTTNGRYGWTAPRVGQAAGGDRRCVFFSLSLLARWPAYPFPALSLLASSALLKPPDTLSTFHLSLS